MGIPNVHPDSKDECSRENIDRRGCLRRPESLRASAATCSICSQWRGRCANFDKLVSPHSGLSCISRSTRLQESASIYLSVGSSRPRGEHYQAISRRVCLRRKGGLGALQQRERACLEKFIIQDPTWSNNHHLRTCRLWKDCATQAASGRTFHRLRVSGNGLPTVSILLTKRMVQLGHRTRQHHRHV